MSGIRSTNHMQPVASRVPSIASQSEKPPPTPPMIGKRRSKKASAASATPVSGGKSGSTRILLSPSVSVPQSRRPSGWHSNRAGSQGSMHSHKSKHSVKSNSSSHSKRSQQRSLNRHQKKKRKKHGKTVSIYAPDHEDHATGDASQRGKSFFGVITKKQNKVRGRSATQVHIPWFLRFCSNRYSVITFELIICTLYSVYNLMASYLLVFQYESHTGDLILTVIEFILVGDLIFRLMVESWRQFESLEYVVFLIPCTLPFVVIELVALLPLSQMAALFQKDSMNSLRLIYALKFCPILGWYRLYKVSDLMEENHFISEYSAFLFRYFAMYFAFVHYVTCLLFAITGITSLDFLLWRHGSMVQGTWLDEGYIVKPGMEAGSSNHYLLSLGLCITMLTTTGYGDLSPRNETEMCFAIAVMLFGAILLTGYFGSTLTGFLLNHDGERYEFFHRVDLILKLMDRVRAPAILVHRIREYYDNLWNFRQGVHRAESLRLMPDAVRDEILLDICEEMFERSFLFRGLDSEFLRTVSKHVEVIMYTPDTIVCQQGEPTRAMYFIIQGECAVKTPHDCNQVSAILRPKSIFGESNLLLSIPLSANIETRTCCQFLVLQKSSLLNICLDFNSEIMLNVLRMRLHTRIQRVRDKYEGSGEYPISWARRKSDKDDASYPEGDYVVTLRSTRGFNRKQDPDALGYTEVPVIVSMSGRTKTKESLDIYGQCSMPMSMVHEKALIRYWHFFIAVLCITLLIITNVSYGTWAFTQEVEFFFTFGAVLDDVASIAFILDIFIEIFTTAPVSGLYYKFLDGFRIKRRQISFYIDIVSCISVDSIEAISIAVFSRSSVGLVLEFGHLFVARFFKVFKFFRYLNFLDERCPSWLVQLRILRMAIMTVTIIISIAGVLFFLACPPPDDMRAMGPLKCSPISWLRSYSILSFHDTGLLSKDTTDDSLTNRISFLAPLHFSAATITGAGFGDFSPQNVPETIFCVLLQFLGVFLAGYYTSKLTSALAACSILDIRFEERLLSINNFFALHGLSMKLRDSIIEHYKLQRQYHNGVSLPPNVHYMLYDAPPHMSDEALYALMGDFLEGIPAFTHCDPQVLISLAKLGDVFVVPSNITFIHRGDVRRQMYVVLRGTVAVVASNEQRTVKKLLPTTCHFGLRDLLLGESAKNDIVTVSYCVLFVIDYFSFTAIFQDDEDLQKEIEMQTQQLGLRSIGFSVLNQNLKIRDDIKRAKPNQIPSWIVFPSKASKRNKSFCTFEEFMEGYDVPFGKIFKLLLMKRTVHPAGTFALIWCLLNAVAGLVLLFVYVFRLLPGYRANGSVQIFLYVVSKVLLSMDMYVRLHWGYYTESNYFICHPVETAKHYLLQGPFLFNLLFELIEYSNMLTLYGATDIKGQGGGDPWVSKFLILRVVYLFRLSNMFQVGRQVSTYRTLLLGTIYLVFMIMASTVMAIIALGLSCTIGQHSAVVQSAYESTCTPGFAASKLFLQEALQEGFGRWIISLYYVLQCTLGVGYGDMISLDDIELSLTVFMVIFGYIFTRAIISDIAAAVLSGDELRLEYQEKIRRVLAVMQKQQVDPVLIEKVDEHLTHAWYLSRGLQPAQLLSGLHPALQTELFREYIGEAVSRVPIFAMANPSTIRSLCTYLTKLYFNRGDRIARRENYEFEMYIIVDGDVWVTSKNKELRCTLGPGESFGESNMMYGIQRKYSMFAENSVEVFALDALSFSDILLHYPGLKYAMEKQMKWKRRDLFERKVHLLDKMKEKMGISFVAPAISRIASHITQLESYETVGVHVVGERQKSGVFVFKQKNAFSKFARRWIFAWGPLNTGLPFIYLATPVGNKRPRPLLHPRCGLQRFFSSIVTLVSVASPVLAIFIAVSGDHTTDFVFLAFDIIYWLHILLQFFTPFSTLGGFYCKEFPRIAFRYVSTLSRFWLDVVSSLPIGLVVQYALRSQTYAGYLNLLRTLRLVHYFRTLDESLDQITVTTFGHSVLNSVTWFCLMAHVLACIFYLESPCGSIQHAQNFASDIYCFRPGTWTSAFVHDFFDDNPTAEDLKPWRWYVRSLYWVMATLITAGFGDIVPISLEEVGICIVCMLCGAFLLGIILGQLTHGITSLNRFWRQYLYQLRVDVQYLGSLGLSVHRQEAVIEWFLLRWHYSRGCTYARALSILPLCFRNYVSLALYNDVLSKVPLFQDLDIRFFTMLASFLEHEVYLPGQVIAHEGDKANYLFILASGLVSGHTLSKNGNLKLLRWYKDGCVFGRLPVLFYNHTYTKTYRAEVVSEILTVSKQSVFYLCRFFKIFASNMQELIEDFYDPTLGTDTIFTPEFNPNVRNAYTQAPAKYSNVHKTWSQIPHHKRKRVTFIGQLKIKHQKRSHGNAVHLVEPAKQARVEAAMETRMQKHFTVYDSLKGSRRSSRDPSINSAIR